MTVEEKEKALKKTEKTIKWVMYIGIAVCLIALAVVVCTSLGLV